MASIYIVYTGINEEDDMNVVSPINGELKTIEYKEFRNIIGKAIRYLIVSLPLTNNNVTYLKKDLYWFYSDDSKYVFSRVFLTNYIDEHHRRLTAAEVYVAKNFNDLKAAFIRVFKYPSVFSKDRSTVECSEKMLEALKSGKYKSGINYPVEKIDLYSYEYKDWKTDTDPFKYGVTYLLIALIFGMLIFVKWC